MNASILPTTPGVPASTPQQGAAGAINDPLAVQQNQNHGMPVVGEHRNQQPLEQQTRGVQKDVPPNLCCFCELRTGLTVMAVVDIIFQGYGLWEVYRSRSLVRRLVGEIPMDLEMYFVAEFFFRTLAVTAFLMLLVFNCMEHKVLTTVSHVIGWIPLLASYIYGTVFFMNYMILAAPPTAYTVVFILGTIIALSWKIYESVVVYYCWKEIPGQYAKRRNQGYNGGYGQTNYGAGAYGGYAVQPNHGGYGQPGAYGQPGGYGQPAAGYGGYSGYAQPGYGQPSGYAGYGTPPPAYGHYGGYGRM